MAARRPSAEDRPRGLRGVRRLGRRLALLRRLAFPVLAGRDVAFATGRYDPTLFQLRGRARFGSPGLKKRFNELFNHSHWHALANDKLAVHFVLEGLGLPSPGLHAVTHPGGRFCGDAPCFRGPDELSAFLRGTAPYPLFVKPVWGAFGRSSLALLEHEAAGDRLLLGNGERRGLENVVAELSAPPYGNHLLLQELLRPHPDTLDLCGDHLTTVRVIVLLHETGSELYSATWRIPTGGNMTDNFARGRTGNLLATVDPEGGRVLEARGRLDGAPRTIEIHPRTGRRLVGAVLPDWRELRRVTLAAASALPGLRMQHWDLALCPRGPVLLEVNALGDLSLREMVLGRS